MAYICLEAHCRGRLDSHCLDRDWVSFMVRGSCREDRRVTHHLQESRTLRPPRKVSEHSCCAAAMAAEGDGGPVGSHGVWRRRRRRARYDLGRHGRQERTDRGDYGDRWLSLPRPRPQDYTRARGGHSCGMVLVRHTTPYKSSRSATSWWIMLERRPDLPLRDEFYTLRILDSR